MSLLGDLDNENNKDFASSGTGDTENTDSVGSIFGDLDIEDINTNPYWIAAGEYRAKITDAKIAYNENRNTHQLRITYRIHDPDGEFHKKPHIEFLNIYPGITKETYNNLPIKEKRKVKNDLTRLKKRLCGIKERKNTPGLGISETTDFKNWDPKELVDKVVDIGISNWGEEDQGVNVRYANVIDDDDLTDYLADNDNEFPEQEKEPPI